MRVMGRRGALVLAGWCTVLAACGTGEERASVASGAPPWRSSEIGGVPHADIEPTIASHDDEVVALFVDEDGLLTAATVDASGTVTAAGPSDLELGYPGVGGAVWFDGRWLAMTSGRAVVDDIVYDVRVLASDDGLTWEELDTTGLEGPAEVGEVVVVGDRLVAVGTARTAQDPSQGGFLPIAWTSADGRAWERIALPLDGADQGHVSDAIALEDRVLATGGAGGRGMLWESRDGSTWTIRDDDELAATAGLGALLENDGVVLASAHVATPEEGEDGEMGRAHLLRSTDGGASWRAVDPPPDVSGGFPPDVRSGGGWFFASRRGRQASYEPEECYVDIEWCRNPPTIGGALYASRDGQEWDRVDTRGIPEPGTTVISGTSDGVVVLLVPRAEDSVLWTWPAGTPLAFRDADAVAEPPDTTGIEVARYDTPLEVGRRYPMPLGGHCGYEWFYADDRPWHLDGEEVYPTESSVFEMVYGYVTLVDEDTLEYELEDGEVIATFSVPTEDPPGCA